VWKYLDSGTGVEATKTRNRAALDQVQFHPSILHGPQEMDISTTFLVEDYLAPFGAAPIGMSGLIWPDAEGILARSLAQAQLPFSISTLATQSPEDVAPHLGDHAWFQLYPPKREDIRQDLLDRARAAGVETLVLTADVPVASRRERQTRSGIIQPPRLTLRLAAKVAIRPGRWPPIGAASRNSARSTSTSKRKRRCRLRRISGTSSAPRWIWST